MRCDQVFAALLLLTLSTVSASAQDQAADRRFSIGEGKITLTAPEGWTKKEPASRIVEAEFSIPPAAGEEVAGRLTAMGAGGSVEDNINRWVGQFAPTGNEAVKPKRDKLTANGIEVAIVDLSGTYKDMPGGPFAGGKTIERPNYRMLGAILQTKDAGNYFLKLYGPKATIDRAESGFMEMVKSAKVK